MRKKIHLSYKKIILPLFMAAVVFCGQAFSYLLAVDEKNAAFSIAETGVTVWHAYDANNDGNITMPDNSLIANSSFTTNSFVSADNTSSDEIYKSNNVYALSSSINPQDSIFNTVWVENTSLLNKYVYCVIKNPCDNSENMCATYENDNSYGGYDGRFKSLSVNVDVFAINAPSTAVTGNSALLSLLSSQKSDYLGNATTHTVDTITPVFAINNLATDTHWKLLNKSLVDENNEAYECFVYVWDTVLSAGNKTAPLFTGYDYLPEYDFGDGYTALPGSILESYMSIDYNDDKGYPLFQWWASPDSYLYMPTYQEASAVPGSDIFYSEDEFTGWYFMDSNILISDGSGEWIQLKDLFEFDEYYADGGVGVLEAPRIDVTSQPS